MDDRQLTDRINILADLLVAKGLRKIELSDGDMRLSIEAGGEEIGTTDGASSVKVAKSAPVGVMTPERPPEKSHRICSPAVGTVYLSGGVGQEPFVKCGMAVRKGQKLCVLESMKMFNDLNCDTDGVIESVCVSNGQVVGVGDVLFTVSKGENE